jgi:hypothetical protein
VVCGWLHFDKEYRDSLVYVASTCVIPWTEIDLDPVERLLVGDRPRPSVLGVGPHAGDHAT